MRLLSALLLIPVSLCAQTSNWTQQSPTTAPFPRYWSAAAYDSAHSQVILFGGLSIQNGGNVDFADTWAWDGKQWTQLSPKNSPPARDSHVMAYDPVHGQVVLFGGEFNNTLADTWFWDGTNWTQLQQASPGPRWSPTMVWDAAHAEMVMFGGNDGNGDYLNETWIWNGSAWAQKSPKNSPPARSDGMMVYDSVHNQTVLFGGYGAAGNLNDTWIWDGSNWTQAYPTVSPSPRSDANMAFDTAQGKTILYGGANTTEDFGDTWIWDGATWTQQSPATSPVPHWGGAIAYDAGHSQVVLFGGVTGNNIYGSTWTWQTVAAGPTITNIVSASAFGAFAAAAPGSWVEIYGSNLAPDSRPWAASDFTGTTAPTSLDGVSVTIAGQKASVAYISSGQVNAQLPSGIAAGTQQITVTNGSTSSPAVNFTVNATEPGLLAPTSFQVGGNQYAVALLTDGITYVLPVGAIAGLNSRPAHPGETIVLYGVGFGPVTPAVAAGQITPGTNQLTSNLQVLFSGVPAQVTYDGLAPGIVGLYQINVTVPQMANSNLVQLTFTLGGVPGTQTLYTAVGQ